MLLRLRLLRLPLRLRLLLLPLRLDLLRLQLSLLLRLNLLRLRLSLLLHLVLLRRSDALLRRVRPLLLLLHLLLLCCALLLLLHRFRPLLLELLRALLRLPGCPLLLRLLLLPLQLLLRFGLLYRSLLARLLLNELALLDALLLNGLALLDALRLHGLALLARLLLDGLALFCLRALLQLLGLGCPLLLRRGPWLLSGKRASCPRSDHAAVGHASRNAASRHTTGDPAAGYAGRTRAAGCARGEAHRLVIDWRRRHAIGREDATGGGHLRPALILLEELSAIGCGDTLVL